MWEVELVRNEDFYGGKAVSNRELYGWLKQQCVHKKGTTGLNGFRMLKTLNILCLGCWTEKHGRHKWHCRAAGVKLISMWEAGSVPLKMHDY